MLDSSIWRITTWQTVSIPHRHGTTTVFTVFSCLHYTISTSFFKFFMKKVCPGFCIQSRKPLIFLCFFVLYFYANPRQTFCSFSTCFWYVFPYFYYVFVSNTPVYGHKSWTDFFAPFFAFLSYIYTLVFIIVLFVFFPKKLPVSYPLFGAWSNSKLSNKNRIRSFTLSWNNSLKFFTGSIASTNFRYSVRFSSPWIIKNYTFLLTM